MAHARRLAALLLSTLLVAACGQSATFAPPSSLGATDAPSSAPTSGSAAPSAGANPSDLATFVRIEAQVEQLRGLTATNPVTPVLLDPKALTAKLTQLNDAETNHVALANEGKLLVHMGLLPEGSDLEKLELALDSEQVVGFYDPESKGLYVLSASGDIGPTEKTTFSHEYTHALQDQNFGLDKLAIDTPDQGDRDIAHTALPEGDATLLMTLWSSKYLTASELIRMAGESLAAGSGGLDSAPAILRETLLFPYDDGLAFVTSAYRSGGWAAVDALYAKPPASTSQVLHPELYTGGVQPVAVTVPDVPGSLSGWKLTMQDTLGELQLRIWLEQYAPGSGSLSPASAVSTWAGDRVGLYEGPSGGWAVVLDTAWRTSPGRDGFMQAATNALTALGRPNRICGYPSRVDLVIASADSVLSAFLDCNTMG